jgi:hypothetical protein
MYKALNVFLPVLVLWLLIGATSACTNDSKTKAVAETERDHLEELKESLKSLKDGNGEVLEISALKEALPEKLSGMNRISHNGQRSQIAGIKISSADARYEDGEKRMSVSIMDTGGLGAALASLASWTEIEMDNESVHGYERTAMIDGNKAIEKYDRNTKQGEISLISENRFVLTVKSSNVSEQELRKAVSKIKIQS